MSALANDLGGFRDALDTLRSEDGEPLVGRVTGQVEFAQLGAALAVIERVRADIQRQEKNRRELSRYRNQHRVRRP